MKSNPMAHDDERVSSGTITIHHHEIEGEQGVCSVNEWWSSSWKRDLWGSQHWIHVWNAKCHDEAKFVFKTIEDGNVWRIIHDQFH